MRRCACRVPVESRIGQCLRPVRPPPGVTDEGGRREMNSSERELERAPLVSYRWMQDVSIGQPATLRRNDLRRSCRALGDGTDEKLSSGSQVE